MALKPWQIALIAGGVGFAVGFIVAWAVKPTEQSQGLVPDWVPILGFL